jgi:hypothetical protein
MEGARQYGAMMQNFPAEDTPSPSLFAIMGGCAGNCRETCLSLDKNYLESHTKGDSIDAKHAYACTSMRTRACAHTALLG